MEVRSPEGEARAAATAPLVLLVRLVWLQLLPEDGPRPPPTAPDVPSEGCRRARAQRGMQAGVLLTSALLPFSSGSCETENIVGSEMNVSGKFIFPGKNRCAVAAATTPALRTRGPWPCCPPHCAPRSSSRPRLAFAQQTRRPPRAARVLPPPPLRLGWVGAEPICRAPPPRGCGLRTAPPLPLLLRPQGDSRDRHGLRALQHPEVVPPLAGQGLPRAQVLQ